MDDMIHINTAGLIRLGRRMARQALHLTDRPEIPVGPRPERLERAAAPNGLPVIRLHCSGMTGPWQPETIFGFSLTTLEGAPHPDLMVANARPDPHDPNAIRLLLNSTPADGVLDSVRLAYGLGFSPCCNAVDQADMALCSFLPKPLDWER